MPYFEFKNIKITAIASAVPKNIVKSTDFNGRFTPEGVEKFVEMTGVKEHRKTGKNQTASDLGYAAAEKILFEKNIDRDSIGTVIFGAHSTDYRRPATACVLHKRLGLGKECAAFDISLGCSAFVYCVQVAAAMMNCSDIKRALVITGETMTKMVNENDKSAAMLFGDGGAAALLEKTDNPDDEIKGLLRSDGNGYRAIIAPAGGFRNMNAPADEMIWQDGNPRTLYNTNMNGTDVFAFTISDVPRAIKYFLKKTETTVDDYDCYAMHQANQFIHKQLAKKLKMDIEKMPLCLDKYGNTSAPAIPLTLCDAYAGSEEKEMNVLMCGFGVGLSWGVLSAKINTANIYPVIETDEYFAEGIINSPEDM